MELGQRVIKGLKTGATLRLAAQVFTWLNTLILIRLLTPDDYGLMAMAMAFIGILALMGDFGVAKALIQTEGLTDRLLSQAFTVNILSCTVLFLLFYNTAPLIAAFFSEPRVTALVQVVALQHLILVFHTLPYALASRNMLYKEREKVQFVATLSTSVFTLILAFFGAGVWALILGHLFMRVVATIGFIRLQPVWIRPALSFEGFHRMALFSGIATLNDALRYLYNIFTNISIGHLLNKTDLGVFSVARNLANLPSDKIGELLNHLGLSSLARLQNERPVAGQYLLKSIQLGSLVLFPMYLGMCAISPELITLVLSEKWTAVIIPFQILCLSSPFRMLSEMLATSVTAIGEPGKNTQALSHSLLLLPLILVGIQFGVIGACIAWLIVTLISFVFHMKTVLPELSLSWQAFLDSLLPGFISAAVMLAGLTLFRIELSDTLHSGLLMVSMMILGCLLFVGMMTVFFRHHANAAIRYLRH